MASRQRVSDYFTRDDWCVSITMNVTLVMVGMMWRGEAWKAGYLEAERQLQQPPQRWRPTPRLSSNIKCFGQCQLISAPELPFHGASRRRVDHFFAHLVRLRFARFDHERAGLFASRNWECVLGLRETNFDVLLTSHWTEQCRPLKINSTKRRLLFQYRKPTNTSSFYMTYIV